MGGSWNKCPMGSDGRLYFIIFSLLLLWAQASWTTWGLGWVLGQAYLSFLLYVVVSAIELTLRQNSSFPMLPPCSETLLGLSSGTSYFLSLPLLASFWPSHSSCFSLPILYAVPLSLHPISSSASGSDCLFFLKASSLIAIKMICQAMSSGICL
jgi:hypothetical protein